MNKKVVIILREITFILPILFIFLTSDINYVISKNKDYWTGSLLFVIVTIIVFVSGIFSLKKYTEEKRRKVIAIIGMVIMLCLLSAWVFVLTKELIRFYKH